MGLPFPSTPHSPGVNLIPRFIPVHPVCIYRPPACVGANSGAHNPVWGLSRPPAGLFPLSIACLSPLLAPAPLGGVQGWVGQRKAARRGR